MSRFTIVVAVALQLFGCLAPANAFVICVSNDGCVEIEPAASGAARCVEDECDRHHADDPSHGCRDIAVRTDAIGLKTAPTVDGGAAALVALPPTLGRMDALGSATPISGAVHRPPAPPRTVVLQL